MTFGDPGAVAGTLAFAAAAPCRPPFGAPRGTFRRTHLARRGGGLLLSCITSVSAKEAWGDPPTQDAVALDDALFACMAMTTGATA